MSLLLGFNSICMIPCLQRFFTVDYGANINFLNVSTYSMVPVLCF